MKKAKNILNIFITCISIIIILLNIYVIYEKAVLKKDAVDVFGYSFFIVISGSMEPNIHINDLIIIKNRSDYTINDIVTFKSNKSLVTHRIVRIDGEKIYTKGDSNNTEDEPITKDKIRGKVVFKLRGIGKVLEIITAPVTIVIFIAISAWLIVKTNIKT